VVRYLIRRLLFLALVLWIVSGLTFLIFVKLPPGDPARRAAGRTSTPQTIHAARIALGLDKPVWVQYARFAKGLIPWPGFFLNKQVYYSWSDFVPISENIYSKLPVTVALAVGGAVVWLSIGIPIGIISAVRRRSFTDRAGMIFALLGLSLPVFWLAYLFLYLFWYRLHIAPGSGIPQGMSLFGAVLHGSFVLPWVVLALAFSASDARQTRANLIESLSEDYIRTARAKGLSERRVIVKHGMRSALTPLVTIFGIDFGTLLGGAFITETVFNLDGVGRYAVNSLRRNDFPAVMGVTVFASFFIIVANLVVDIAYAFLDPRVRYR
jgi:peptide/nickel transport system permease protein